MKNRNLVYTISFFLLVLLLVGLTFYTPFNRIIALPHTYSVWIIIHAFSLLVWVLLLILQPLLIYFDNRSWHRQLGWLSVTVVATIVITTCFIALNGFFIAGPMPAGKKYSVLLSQLYSIMLFALLYTLALIHVKKMVRHTQYILASTFVIIGPVIFRSVFNFGLSFFGTVAITANVLTYALINLLLVLLCYINARQEETYFPYLLTLLALIPVELSQCWFAIN